MKRRRQAKAIVAVAIVGAVAALGVALSRLLDHDRGPWTITIATATEGGTYYPLGNQLARILEGLPNERVATAEAMETRGSRENVELLMDSRANIAFVMGPALVSAVEQRPGVRDTLALLAHLYTDVVQIVVRKDARIENIADLENTKIFIGPDGSGTRLVATRILDAAGLSTGDYSVDEATSFAEAAAKLIDGTVSAAFFMAGMPAEAVQAALESGQVALLNLDDSTRATLTASGELSPADIPANFYGGQPQKIQTVGAEVFLTIRRDQPNGLAETVLEVLLDKIVDLLIAHQKAGDIRLTTLFHVPENFPLRLHPGADQFDREQGSALLIATGALGGTYYELGRMIQQLLEGSDIDARVTHTDGSLENAELLGTRYAIAIMQYDAALASRIGESRFVYNVDLPRCSIPAVKNIRRLATLHEEQVHVIVRRETLANIEKELDARLPTSERVPITTLGQLAEALRTLSPSQQRLRISLGPRRSATQVVAQAILEHHGIPWTAVTPSFLSVSDVANRLHGEEIDLAFFVSHVPSAAIETVLNDDRIGLLSLGAKERALMTGTVFTNSTIEPGTYASQKEGEPAVQTLATRAVLVTTGDLPLDVEAITRAIFEGEAFLDIHGGAQAMAEDLPSLPFHPAAKRYCEKARLCPAKPPIDWFGATWRTLASMVILISGYRGLLRLRRERTFSEMTRQTIAIPVEASFQDSVATLLAVRDEIQERVRRRWWQPGELDKGRWRYMYDLVNDRVAEAKDNLTRALAAEVRALAADAELDENTRQQRRESIKTRIAEYFEKGELDASQRQILCELIQEDSQHGPDTREERFGP
ncbi:MAG: TAXI family TRAP transporter solute-binding subunit [Gemmatimonadota bacterium]|nr:MAG: TAXI family TRAP transporter solute-binding subunit [Gemmatimonadota bacterium]